jgi:iron complex outermembrane receptor protein
MDTRTNTALRNGTCQRTGPGHTLRDWCRQAARFTRNAGRCLAGLLLSLAVIPLTAQGAGLPDDLLDMSLEALMDIEITSVSKKPQKKSTAAAAVFVITNDDLRRWGVTNIPDALRRVPGLQVARIDANKWAITSRGFNSRFANKLLVLIDGRSIYTPLFAGVYWDANQVMLEDVERIEVIRGPGGTLWGANAVNGVINIITKSAADTQGTLVAAGAGNELVRLVNVRHGGVSESGVNYRVYAMSHSADTGYSPAGAHDDAEIAQAGFRTDWESGGSDRFTLQGDIYESVGGQDLMILPSLPGTIIDDADTKGSNLLYRWTHTSSPDSDFTLQVYYDHVGRDSAVLFEDRDTFDLDFQQHISWSEHQDVVWGLNYRNIKDDTHPRSIFSLTPSKRRVDLYTAFVQDEISLADDRARLTLGSKFEYNDFTGFEAQPNVRLAWRTDAGNTVWCAVSRAVRTPARGEHDVSLAVIPPSPLTPPLTIFGSDAFASENLLAYEIGFRRAIKDKATLDVTAFYNRYDDLRTIDIFSMAPLEASFDNNMEGDTQGIEVDVHWQTRPWLAVNANYTWLEVDLDLVNGSMDTISQSVEDGSPEHQANLWLAANLDNNIELDAGLRYVGSLQNFGFPKTGDYLAFDARIGWTPKPGLEVSLVGQNLFDSHHPEFNPDFIFSIPTEVERSIHGQVSWTF